jgi:hypothetical protein
VKFDFSHERKKDRLNVVENNMLRKILGSKGQEVRIDWRKLHNEELPH